MPSPEQSATFLPPLPPASPCIPSSTHPSRSVAFLVAAKQRKPPNAETGRPSPGPQSMRAMKKKVLYVEPMITDASAEAQRVVHCECDQNGVPRIYLDAKSLLPPNC